MFKCPVCGATVQRRYGLTHAQAKALNFIKSFIAEFGWSPSYDEIAEAMGLSPKSKVVIHRYVRALEARGYIISIPNHQRSIAIMEAEPHVGQGSHRTSRSP